MKNEIPNTSTEVQNKLSFKRKNFEKKRLKYLKKQQIKKMGFIETVYLKIRGSLDGTRGLPVKNDDSWWSSPFIDHELNSYRWFCERMWSMFQIEQEKCITLLDVKVAEIYKKEYQFQKSQEALKKASIYNTTDDQVPKKGEENLTNNQLKIRRQNEFEKFLSSYKNKVIVLESELYQLREEFIQIYSILNEKIDTNMLICKVMKQHIKRRLDIYWNSALQKFNVDDYDMIPAVPNIIFPEYEKEGYERYKQKIQEKATFKQHNLVKELGMEVVKNDFEEA